MMLHILKELLFKMTFRSPRKQSNPLNGCYPMDTLESFRTHLHQPQHLFSDTLSFINWHYQYQPCAFSNGALHSAIGENEGSCKILGLALLEGLTAQETLLAFGEHYRAVLTDPDGQNHPNIRMLMQQGLTAVRFEQLPLQRKSSLS